MLRLKVTPVVGLPQFTGWSQVAESTVSPSARLICVYAISGKHAGNVGRDISQTISNFYFSDVEQFHEFLQSIIDTAHQNECKIFLACALIGRTTSIFTTYGGSIFLKRGSKVGKILSSETEIKILQGNYDANDVFVLTTSQADQFLSEIEIKFVQGYDVDIIITSVVPGLHAQVDSSLSALVFITKDDVVAEDKVIETELIIEPEADQFDEEKEYAFTVEDDENESNENQKIEESAPAVSVSITDTHIGTSLAKNKQYVQSLLLVVGRAGKSLWHLIIKVLSFLVKIVVSTVHVVKNRRQLSRLNGSDLNESLPRKTKIKLFLIGTVCLLILLVSAIIFKVRADEKARVSELLAPVMSDFEVAQKLADSDPIVAREMLTTLQTKLEKIETENNESSAIALVTDTSKEVSEFLTAISGKKELTELSIVYDLRLVKSDFIASGIDLIDTSLLLFDKDKKESVFLDLGSKQVASRSFTDRSELTDMVVVDNVVYILSDGVYSYPVTKADAFDEVRGLGDSNESATFINAFDRFVYVINPEKRNIYRYSKSDEGYSEPVGWIKSATGLEYTSITSFSIDGDIWLTTKDGQIKKFTSGREEQFVLRGVTDPFEKEVYLYTNNSLAHLYVLDPSKNRVVVISKNGDFVTEYKSVSLASATDLAVSEESQRAYIISGSLVYEIELTQ